MTKLLPNGWFEFPEKVRKHTEILRLRNDIKNKKYKTYIICAGRRSFKTQTLIRIAVEMAISTPDFHILIAAPVHAQTKRIWFKPIQKLIPPTFIDKVSVVDFSIDLINGSNFTFFSGDNVGRVVGVFADMAIIDEIGHISADDVYHELEPVLNDRGGIFIGVGTPVDKSGIHYELFNMASVNPMFGAYHWTSEEILSEEQIRAAKASLSENEYKLQYMASWESNTSAPYYAFSRNNIKGVTYRGGDIIISMDFNATDYPMSWIIGQEVGDKLEVFDLIFRRFTNTEEACKLLIEKLIVMGFNKGHKITLYGDYSGSRLSSNSSYSDWAIIKRVLNEYKLEIKIKPTRSVKDAVESVNARLKTMDGEHHIFINPDTCRPLVYDLENVSWNKTENDTVDTDKLGHLCKSMNYYCDYKYPIRGRNYTEVT